MAENIKSRKYYRVHNGTDWDRMHFVTDANSVDANDGQTLEEKVGAIKGITTSTFVTEEGYAADATTVSALSNRLNNSLGDLKFGYDVESEKYGYYVTDREGADTFFPFSGGKPIYLGTGTTFDVSSYRGYENFTINNFIICASSVSTRTYDGGGHDMGSYAGSSCSINPVGTYNPSNGVLTISGTSSSCTGTFRAWDYVRYFNSASSISAPKVYLVPDGVE